MSRILLHRKVSVVEFLTDAEYANVKPITSRFVSAGRRSSRPPAGRSAMFGGAAGNISQTISRAMAGPDAENIQIHLQSMSPFRFVPK